MKKIVAFLISGLIICAVAFYLVQFRDTQAPLIDDIQFFIMVAGEGFDKASNPTIYMEFDDEGNIDIDFEGDDILWMTLFDMYPYDWEIEGNIESYFPDGTVAGIHSGKQDTLLLLRVETGSDEHIIIKNSNPVSENLYRVRINAPIICAEVPNLSGADEILNDIVDNLNESSIDEIRDKVNDLFAIANIGDVQLSPAVPEIHCRYNDTLQYKNKYRLFAAPSGYTEDTSGLSWVGFQQLFPVIEYQKEVETTVSKRLTEALFLIGTFFLTTGVVEFVLMIRKKNR